MLCVCLQALKSTVLQPFLNVVDWCLESNQAFKLSHPNAYHRVLLVLQPVFILLYLYDVYSDIQVAQVSTTAFMYACVDGWVSHAQLACTAGPRVRWGWCILQLV